ncbi:MAG: signal peptidase II [Candidatus Binatia bacterium]
MSGRASAALVALIFLFDRWTKHLVVQGWQLGESTEVVPGFFSLTYLRNRGAAFGLFADLPEAWRVSFFVVFALATLAALVWMLRTSPREDVAQRLALTAVIGGAIGNLWDRVRYGEVVDFLDVYVRDWHWPAFNVADSFITCGVILLVLASLRSPQGDSDQPGSAPG